MTPYTAVYTQLPARPSLPSELLALPLPVARCGEFRVAPSGDMLLVNMLGEKLERLGPPD